MNTKYKMLTIIHAFKRYCYVINSTIKLIKCYIYINYSFMIHTQKLNIFIKYCNNYCNNFEKTEINFCSMICDYFVNIVLT